MSIFHVDVIDPKGNPVLYYSGNLIVKHGGGIKSIPLAVSDAVGSGPWLSATC